MVTSPHYLATQSGLRVLREGGTAIDAAIAVSAVLTVVYPQMCTLGGDAFWLIWNAGKSATKSATKRADKSAGDHDDERAGQPELRALNASGRSCAAATREFYTSKGLQAIPPRGYLAANTVPGLVSGWAEALGYSQAALGSTQALPNLLADAINYAREGAPVSTSLSHWLTVNCDRSDDTFRHLQRFAGFTNAYLKSGGEPYQVGEILRLPDLANTLTRLASAGPDAFYRGDLAQAIVADLQANQGLLTLADFEEHRADWVDPIQVPYRDCVAYNFPPNTQGMSSLAILNILNQLDLSKIQEGSADYYHLLIEASKQAFADRDLWLTDPSFVDIPLQRLLSAEHGKRQAARIRFDQTARDVAPLDPHGDTVWFGVVDATGNAVSLIQSVYHDFGSAIVPKGTGVILQNRGSFFSLDPKAVNTLEPRKRCFHTLNPAMLFKNGRPLLVYGTMGGEGQPQTQAAIATRVIDYRMTPAEAIEAPRWLHGRTWGAASNSTRFESRIEHSVTDELARRGHPVQRVEDFTDAMGHAGAIYVDPDSGVRYGANDPRSDGCAAGY
jgi:oxamate amidohydrolase